VPAILETINQKVNQLAHIGTYAPPCEANVLPVLCNRLLAIRVEGDA